MTSDSDLTVPPLPAAPVESGTTESQVLATAADRESLEAAASTAPVNELPMSTTLRAVAEGGLRGQAGMAVLITHIQGLENQIAQVTSEREKAQQTAGDFQEKYYEEREKVAVGNAKQASAKTVRLLANATSTVGAITVGASIPFLNAGIGIAALIGGIILLVVGWWASAHTGAES